MVRFLLAAAAAFLMFLRAAARCLALAMDFSSMFEILHSSLVCFGFGHR
jgi:hypothetical protein